MKIRLQVIDMNGRTLAAWKFVTESKSTYRGALTFLEGRGVQSERHRLDRALSNPTMIYTRVGGSGPHRNLFWWVHDVLNQKSKDMGAVLRTVGRYPPRPTQDDNAIH